MKPASTTDNLYWDDSNSELAPRSTVAPFVAMICLGTVLYFGLRCAEWWLEPPPVYFPPPALSVIQRLAPSAKFPNGNYYVVPDGLTCIHQKSNSKTLVIVCSPH